MASLLVPPILLTWHLYLWNVESSEEKGKKKNKKNIPNVWLVLYVQLYL